MTEETCKFCRFWQDYTDRVFACVRGKRSDSSRHRIELRRCRNDPPPSVEVHQSIYTDEDYACGGWQAVKS